MKPKRKHLQSDDISLFAAPYIWYIECKNEPRGYYFIDETWADFIGPFPTVFEAKTNLKDYCEYLNAKRKIQTKDN